VVRCLGEKAKDVSGGYLTKSRELAVKTLCIFVLAFAVLYVSTPEAQFSLDGARDEAVASGAIVDWQRGVHASIEGLHHGALWFRYLRATRAAGFDVQGQYLLVTILCAAAAGIFYHLVRTQFPGYPAWPAVAWFIVLTFGSTQRPFMWNPSLVPLSSVLLYYTIARVIRAGSLLAAAFCGVFLALSAALQIGSIGLLPVVVGSAALYCSHRLVGAALVVLTAVTVLFIDSPQSLLSNLHFVRSHYGPVTALFVGSLICAVAAARWMRFSVPAERTLPWLFGISVVWYAGLLVVEGDIGGRLWVPVITPIALFLGVGLDSIARSLRIRSIRWPTGAEAVPIIVLALPLLRTAFASNTLRPDFSMRDFVALARRLSQSNHSLHDARSRLRGPGTALLAFELGLWDRSESVPGVENHDLRVLKPTTKELPMSNWPSDTEAIDVGGGQFLLLMPVDSWVAGQPDRLCIEPVDGSLAQSCFGEGSPTDQPLLQHARREYLSAQRGSRSLKLTFHLPVDIHGEDDERTVQLVGVDGQPIIVNVAGVGFRGDLPGRRVTITRDHVLTGHILVSATFSDSAAQFALEGVLDSVELLESRPAESALRALVEP